ncbi:MAG: ABC transporter ATP-binding protein [Deltaproteobacteria bacterium]|nr:ABC transporter ATP-binding protein [Deltaproteobacteria bacterium]
MSDESVLRLEAVHKSFSHLGREVRVLGGVDLEIRRGAQISIVGKSGVGKSTLLHVAGTLDPPSRGRVLWGDRDLFRMSEPELARWRNRRIGFVFQFHHLLPEFTARENVMLPALIAGRPWVEAARRADALLERLGLSERATHRPGELSGGEQQRVSLGRALVMEPDILFADEPTGNLDERTSEEIHELLVRLNRDLGTALVLVTHNAALARRMETRLVLTEGLLKPCE